MARSDAATRETARDQFGDPLARLPRIGTDQDLGLGFTAGDVVRQGHAEGEYRLPIQRVLAGNSANPVRTEQFFSHSRSLGTSYFFFMVTATLTCGEVSKRT